MRSTLHILTALALATFVPVSLAGDADPDCPGTVVTIGSGNTAVYIVVEEVAGPTYLFSVWVKSESNGEPGCQESDAAGF